MHTHLLVGGVSNRIQSSLTMSSGVNFLRLIKLSLRLQLGWQCLRVVEHHTLRIGLLVDHVLEHAFLLDAIFTGDYQLFGLLSPDEKLVILYLILRFLPALSICYISCIPLAESVVRVDGT